MANGNEFQYHEESIKISLIYPSRELLPFPLQRLSQNGVVGFLPIGGTGRLCRTWHPRPGKALPLLSLALHCLAFQSPKVHIVHHATL